MSKSADTATQLYLQVAEIKDDVLLLKNGGIRGILKITPVNFHLKSEEEQTAIIIGYQGFLNTLNFPIQILVRSRKLNIDNYVRDMEKETKALTNPLLKTQSEDYIQFVSKLVEVADIMEKEFLIVVPYDKEGGVIQQNFFAKFWKRINPVDTKQDYENRLRNFTDLKTKLESRMSTIQSGLDNSSLKNERVKTKELINLFYQTYNPSTSQVEKLDNVDLSDVLQ